MGLTGSKFKDGIPVPYLADRCQSSHVDENAKIRQTHHCKRHIGHKSIEEHTCVCGLTWQVNTKEKTS